MLLLHERGHAALLGSDARRLGEHVPQHAERGAATLSAAPLGAQFTPPQEERLEPLPVGQGEGLAAEVLRHQLLVELWLQQAVLEPPEGRGRVAAPLVLQARERALHASARHPDPRREQQLWP
ncbi:hypothetical protein [Mumia zhuanghuii]|uniref:Uncharacterized protein n=1 Tax=Mumia zhuanghuii TaxID=2585211 RepID=A0A5C4M437_9ACTN|nr:hypothetical protein [Mumia zhuanghuii]TNC26010.1 hypothetical protein FHE65_34745 [Mumia zhuanghuii]